MKIEILARVRFVNPSLSQNRLNVVERDGALWVEYEVYDPSGAVRNAYREPIPQDWMVPGKLYALTEFWDGYTIIEHRAGTYDGIYGAHGHSHKATIAIVEGGAIIFTNTPVELADNVTFGTGEKSFWTRLKELDRSFSVLEEKERTKAEIAAQLDANASVAALEQQVDMLSQIVLAITEGSDNPLIATYRAAVSDLSVFEVKSLAEVLENIRSRKAAVRVRQAERTVKIAMAEALLVELKAQDAEAAYAELATYENQQAADAAREAANQAASVVDGLRARATELKSLI